MPDRISYIDEVVKRQETERQLLRAYQHGYLSCAEGRERMPPDEYADGQSTLRARWYEGWDRAEEEADL